MMLMGSAQDSSLLIYALSVFFLEFHLNFSLPVTFLPLTIDYQSHCLRARRRTDIPSNQQHKPASRTFMHLGQNAECDRAIGASEGCAPHPTPCTAKVLPRRT